MKNNKFVCSVLTAVAAISFTASAYAFPINIASGTPVSEAVRALAARAGKDVVINGELRGTISLNIEDADFDTALNAMSIAGNFAYEYVDDVVLVAPADKLNTIETFKLKHLESEVFSKQLGSIVNGGNVVSDKERNTITVSGSNNLMRRVRSMIEKYDVAQKQINIKATVIELSKSKNREMGLSYMSDPWSKDTSIGGYNGFKFSVTGSHQETLGKGNVLARPNITTFDGKMAKLLMGDNVPVFTSTSDSNDTDSDTSLSVEYKDVGVTLEVLPRINDADKETITMVIKPSVSTITQWVESGNNKAPQISERSAETTVRVKSGETILIGGLLKDEEIKSIKQIPFLSKIPILGELFKTRSIDKRNTEIVIAITPVIVYDEDGVPRVETQTTTPTLRNKLDELQKEPMVSIDADENMKSTDMEISKDMVQERSEVKEVNEYNYDLPSGKNVVTKKYVVEE